MSFRVPQVNFSKGEIGPQLYARFDVDIWQAACKKARNVLIQKYGGLIKRMGTRLVSEVVDPSAPQRLIPFEFSLDQTYVLEFGQGYMAPCAVGGRILETELRITNIVTGAFTQITAAFHGYIAGDPIFITGVDGELGALLNGQFWRVLAVVDANTFVLDVDSEGLTFTGATGGTDRVAPNPTPLPPIFVPLPPQPPAPPTTTPPDGGFVLQPDLNI